MEVGVDVGMAQTDFSRCVNDMQDQASKGEGNQQGDSTRELGDGINIKISGKPSGTSFPEPARSSRENEANVDIVI